MQTDLCDNCKTPAGEGEAGHDGWVKMAKFTMHSGPHDDLPPAIQSLLQQAGQAGQNIPEHLCPTTYDLCSDQCVALFVINGYKPNIEGLFAAFRDISPEDFATAAPKDDDQGT